MTMAPVDSYVWIPGPQVVDCLNDSKVQLSEGSVLLEEGYKIWHLIRTTEETESQSFIFMP